jgi:hypothetical protein
MTAVIHPQHADVRDVLCDPNARPDLCVLASMTNSHELIFLARLY